MQDCHRRKRRGFGFFRHDVLQPVPVNIHGGGAPRALQAPDHSTFGKTFHEFFPPIGQSDIPKFSKKLACGRVKITLRHGRIVFSLCSEKSLYISTVFLQESLCTILWMTLEVYKQALLFLSHERVHAALR